jgi:hypothetical protein
VHHPLCVLERKVHRPNHRNRQIRGEREWLRRYTEWRPESAAYAVEVDLEPGPPFLSATRFCKGAEQSEWLRVSAGTNR